MQGSLFLSPNCFTAQGHPDWFVAEFLRVLTTLWSSFLLLGL